MTECDYCGDAFDDETAYLEHLRDEHEGELGSIDERRVAEFEADQGFDLPVVPLALGGVAVVVLGLVVYATVIGAEGGGIETEPLPERGNETLLSGVETHPSEGRDHVPAGTDIEYERMPPTSGPHYSGTVSAGFYGESQSLGRLVHTLEHGAVVVYYDPAQITPRAEESLRAFASAHTGTWQSFVAVPTPVDDPESAYVLAAWRHSLRMDSYDKRVVRAFVAEYLGRGPENAVR